MTAHRPERLSDIDTAAASQFEGEIREFVRRDVSIRRRVHGGAGETLNGGDAAIANANGLIEQVSGASVAEIDRVIGELQNLRDTLSHEGERVRRQLADFASLSQVAMTSMKIIADSVAQCKPPLPAARADSARTDVPRLESNE